MKRLLALSLALFLSWGGPAASWAQEEGKPADESAKESADSKPKTAADLIDSLAFRNIGPAFMSGRVVDIAVDPVRPSTWYIATGSGGVWKTTNAGTTWSPIFDSYGSYSIGCVTIDPNDHLVVWVGTGENNSQRSVSYGDGLYKSVDGGRSFKRVGLENSEHIAKILVDPRDSDTVYVAVQGPLWAPGGDRGLYKTTDGGATWSAVLTISPDTGVTDIAFDPRDPDVIYAASYQRRRHVWTLINGGPESAIYKSRDAGKTWRKVNRGLPGGDKGRIGLAVSPINPDIVYAIVEAAKGSSGFYRSDDAGESWSRQSDYVSSSPQYYQEIFADPSVFDRVYSLDTLMHVSEDGGKTFRPLGERAKHVDNHALWIDPDDSDHLIVGCDGGLYETWDRGRSYRYTANLPITQFYKIAVDNDAPFYNVYGGTQDNATQGGPSRTRNSHGILSSDWFITVFGDGFDPVVDPENPDIVYSQWQYGGLVRFDRKSGEQVDIKPQEEKGGPALRWNWDSALILSPHSATRLYYGAQMLFRSDDRGDSWTAVSPDLTRDIDRNKLKVMGRVWGVDTVAKNDSTSLYGTIVTISESPLVEGLIYVGTDDGLVQITEDGGENWRKMEKTPFLDLPEFMYVSDIEASKHDPDTVYAAFDNHKNGDFKPYILRSTDRGKTWTLISKDLPEKGSVYCLAQDHEKAELLFAGTEYGVFATLDGGENWHALKSGMPPIAVRDLEIQKRENDLVVGTFGRGIAILDDYSPLRGLDKETLEKPAAFFPIKKALLYVPADPMAGGSQGYQGAGFFSAPNPPFGAIFTYYLKDSLKTLAGERSKKESRLDRDQKDNSYPSWEDLKAEDREESPAMILVIRDADNQVVRRIGVPSNSGMHRVSWNLRWPSFRPVRSAGGSSSGELGGDGPLALPGTYTVSLEKRDETGTTELIAPTPFEVEPLNFATLPAPDQAAVLAFAKQTAELQRAALGSLAALEEGLEEVAIIKRIIEQTPSVPLELRQDARALEVKLIDLKEKFSGDPTRTRRNEAAPPGLVDRIGNIIGGHWSTTTGPTASHRKNFDIATAEFEEALTALRPLLETDLPALHNRLEEAKAPWTPGRRLPDWKK